MWKTAAASVRRGRLGRHKVAHCLLIGARVLLGTALRDQPARRSEGNRVTIKGRLRLGANRLLAGYGLEIVRPTDPFAESLTTRTHPVLRGMPTIELCSTRPAGRASRATARRLMDAYNFAIEEGRSATMQPPQDDLWTNLVSTEFRDLFQIIEDQDVDALSVYLSHYGEEYTWFGSVCLTVDGFTPQGADSLQVALAYLDKLVCLSEALGVLDIENPEQPTDWGGNLYRDPNELVDLIEREIGMPIVPRDVIVPVDGLGTRRGPIHYRHLNSLYAALRIRTLVGDAARICEFGGGLGLVAYYVRELGLNEYTLYDLPISNLFAGHFLIGALGPDAVRLVGEGTAPGKVNVLPYWRCADAQPRTYDLALNQDSFPEIDPSLVLEYFRQIERMTSGYFLSINQEARAAMGTRSQNSVPRLIREFPRFRRMYRMKYWIRQGYVEELYGIQPSAPLDSLHGAGDTKAGGS